MVADQYSERYGNGFYRLLLPPTTSHSLSWPDLNDVDSDRLEDRFMKIEDKCVVLFDYTLTDDDGDVIDSSEGYEPLAYLHGYGNIVPGLERELSGKQVGDKFTVSVSPEEGYGERNEALQQEVPRDRFVGIDDLTLGMQLNAEVEDGHVVVTVVAIDDDVVTVDGNHPLAGVTLNFQIDVREIREATPEELEHGHVHSGDCDH